VQGLDPGYWQGSRTIAGMVGVVTAVLAGSAAGLIAAVAAGHSAVTGFATGGIVAVAAAVAVVRVQHSAWRQIRQHPYFDPQQASAPPASSE
jgi:predicted anti-sigma-YlaC factor YlaD